MQANAIARIYKLLAACLWQSRRQTGMSQVKLPTYFAASEKSAARPAAAAAVRATCKTCPADTGSLDVARSKRARSCSSTFERLQNVLSMFVYLNPTQRGRQTTRKNRHNPMAIFTYRPSEPNFHPQGQMDMRAARSFSYEHSILRLGSHNSPLPGTLRARKLDFSSIAGDCRSIHLANLTGSSFWPHQRARDMARQNKESADVIALLSIGPLSWPLGARQNHSKINGSKQIHQCSLWHTPMALGQC